MIQLDLFAGFLPKDTLCGDLNQGRVPQNPLGQAIGDQPYPFELIKNKTLQFLARALPILKGEYASIPKVARYMPMSNDHSDQNHIDNDHYVGSNHLLNPTHVSSALSNEQMDQINRVFSYAAASSYPDPELAANELYRTPPAFVTRERRRRKRRSTEATSRVSRLHNTHLELKSNPVGRAEVRPAPDEDPTGGPAFPILSAGDQVTEMGANVSLVVSSAHSPTPHKMNRGVAGQQRAYPAESWLEAAASDPSTVLITRSAMKPSRSPTASTQISNSRSASNQQAPVANTINNNHSPQSTIKTSANLITSNSNNNKNEHDSSRPRPAPKTRANLKQQQPEAAGSSPDSTVPQSQFQSQPPADGHASAYRPNRQIQARATSEEPPAGASNNEQQVKKTIPTSDASKQKPARQQKPDQNQERQRKSNTPCNDLSNGFTIA